MEWKQKYVSEGYDVFYQEKTRILNNIPPSKIWQPMPQTNANVSFRVEVGSSEKCRYDLFIDKK